MREFWEFLRKTVISHTIINSTCYTIQFAMVSHYSVVLHACTYLYAPSLQKTITCVDGQAYCNFHGMVQCYRQMLHIEVILHSNFSPRNFVVNSNCYVTQFVTVLHRLYPPKELHCSISLPDDKI